MKTIIPGLAAGWGNYGVKLPLDASAENCMAIELVEDALSEANGMVEYPPEFNG